MFKDDHNLDIGSFKVKSLFSSKIRMVIRRFDWGRCSLVAGRKASIMRSEGEVMAQSPTPVGFGQGDLKSTCVKDDEMAEQLSRWLP